MDSLKPYKLLFQEVINCCLRDYANGVIDENEIILWLADDEAFGIYATYLKMTPDELRAYVQDKIITMKTDKGGVHI